MVHTLVALNPKRTSAVLRNTNLFFIVGMGRSGTTFLSEVLDGATSCHVRHESFGDRRAMVEAYWDIEKAKKYLTGHRQRLIAFRILHSRCTTYGEVNSYLRYHAAALRQLWNPVILHLVRDPRDVVRSIMNRNAYKSSDRRHTGRISPRENDPYFDHWNGMDRFARVCWYWWDANRRLVDMKLPFVRFDDIIRDYGVFRTQVLVPLQIEIPFETWKRAIERPRNVSLDTTFPGWGYWSKKQRDQFMSICGDVMFALGYAL